MEWLSNEPDDPRMKKTGEHLARLDPQTVSALCDLALTALRANSGEVTALKQIAEFSGKTLVSLEHGPAYSIGANAAYEQTADIASEALSRIRSQHQEADQ
jgi:hypothetical protein